MSLNGKTTDFTTDDLIAFAKYADLKPARARSILVEVLTAARAWPTFAAEAGVAVDLARSAQEGFRLEFDTGGR